jgi:prepilin peptidase CpaA
LLNKSKTRIVEVNVMDILLTLCIVFGMTVAAFWDLRNQKIPNVFTFPMMLLGLGYLGIANGVNGICFSAAGICIGFCLFLIPYLLGGMGAGDAKLMGAAGALLGAKGAILAALLAIVFGGIYAMVLLMIHHEYTRSLLRRLGITLKSFFLTYNFTLIPPAKDEKQPVLCYGVPIALGTLCYWYLKVTGSEFIQNLIGVHFRI